MDLSQYRSSSSEKVRIQSLMSMVPENGSTALDVGARDGFFSRLLAEKYSVVTALDLTTPEIDHNQIACVKGDITSLDFSDAAFDLVFCAEVLEHIPPQVLTKACNELQRVTKKHLLVGIPYQQDIRVGRTTCSQCGGTNPPWGHVNNFDDDRLIKLFPQMTAAAICHVGKSTDRTNVLSAALMDLAGNPFGTYDQEEPCIHCGKAIGKPRIRTVPQRILTRVAFIGQQVQKRFVRPHGNWIHILFEKATR